MSIDGSAKISTAEEDTSPQSLTALEANAGDDLEVLLGETVIFDGSNSYSDNWTIVSYEWDLGNGMTKEGEIIEYAYKYTGKYLITLIAMDADGKIGKDVITITVLLPEEAVIHSLIPDIDMLGLHKSIESSLIQKLKEVVSAFEESDKNAAVNKLEIVINEINAQSGKKISYNDAEILTENVNWILNNLNN